MLTLLSILLLLLTPLLIAGLQISIPRFRLAWLISALVTLVVWILLVLLRFEIPVEIPLAIWRPVNLFPIFPSLRMDQVSWSYAFALVSLGLSVIWTDVARFAQNDWRSWSGSLVLTGAGLLAVLAGNPLTLLLFWVLVDGIELVITLFYQHATTVGRMTVLAFANRLVGVFLLLGTSMLAASQDTPLTWDSLNLRWSTYLLVACGLRLGLLPLVQPLPSDLPAFRSLGTLLRLVPVTSTLVLLTRIAQFGVIPSLQPYLLGLTAMTALWGAFFWLRSPTALHGRVYWITGMAMLSIAAAVIAQPASSLAWGLCLLLGGGSLFLYSPPHPRLRPLHIIVLFLLTGLPFTANWASASFFSSLPWLASILYWVTHVSFILGYVKIAWQPASAVDWPERWIWLIYPTGLAFPVISLVAITIWDDQFLKLIRQPALEYYWPGLVTLGLMASVLFLLRKYPTIPLRLGFLSQLQIHPDRLLAPFSLLSNLLGSLTRLANQILEGEGGILWTLVLLVLLLTLLSPVIRGG